MLNGIDNRSSGHGDRQGPRRCGRKGAHCGDGEQRVGAVTGWKCQWRQRVRNGIDNRSSGGSIIAKPVARGSTGTATV